MGNPVVIFKSYANNNTGANATTNVAGHTNFTEIKNDLVPQSGTFPNGVFTVSEFDVVRNQSTVATQDSPGNTALTGGTHINTSYVTRGVKGTFPLAGGQFEKCEFDTGEKAPSIADHFTKSGTHHNYVAFANSGDGKALVRNAFGTVVGAASQAEGPPTAFAPGVPFANIEFDVSHESTPLQAIAGGGTIDIGSGVYFGTQFSNTVEDGDETQTRYFFTLNNEGGRTGDAVLRQRSVEVLTFFEADNGETVFTTLTVTANNTSSAICENWFPGATYSPSTTTSAAHQGTIKFRVHPDSEYVMAVNAVTTNVDVSSVSISANSAKGPIATHSLVTVTCASDHNLSDSQNQIVMSGCDNPAHINGLHNVHSVSNSTVFSYGIVKSTARTEGCVGDFKLQTYDGIDKTGAVLKTASNGSGPGIAEIVHGGCGGNNVVLLRGDTSSNISLGTTYYVYANNTSTTSISSVKFTDGPTYKSMFKEMNLVLDENTGKITSNGVFQGGVIRDEGKEGGFMVLEDATTGVLLNFITESGTPGREAGDDFIVEHSIGANTFYLASTLFSPEEFTGGFILQEDDRSKIRTEDFLREISGQKSGVKELDAFFPKFKHARDFALNRVKSDGSITQDGDTVTIVGTEIFNRLILENDDILFTENSGNTNPIEVGFFTIGLETGSQTFPTKFAEPLPRNARYKTLEYQNGFSCNVSYAAGNNQIIVQNEATINLTPGTADGESYQLSFVDTSWPTPNSSSYWALQEITNAPVIDENNNILIFKSTSEMTNTKVHFTIRAQKVHNQMDVYTGGQGTSTAGSVLNTIDGFGDGFEIGTGNYHDGYFYLSVYNNTDSDRDDFVMVYSDQNNASTSTLDFNGNAFRRRVNEDDPTVTEEVINAVFLEDNYANGSFSVLTSVD